MEDLERSTDVTMAIGGVSRGVTGNFRGIHDRSMEFQVTGDFREFLGIFQGYNREF